MQLKTNVEDYFQRFKSFAAACDKAQRNNYVISDVAEIWKDLKGEMCKICTVSILTIAVRRRIVKALQK